MLEYPRCDQIQPVGSSLAIVSDAMIRIIDSEVEKVEIHCFSTATSESFTISLECLTLRNYACVQTSPFVNLNGKVLISRIESCKEIQPNV